MKKLLFISFLFLTTNIVTAKTNDYSYQKIDVKMAVITTIAILGATYCIYCPPKIIIELISNIINGTIKIGIIMGMIITYENLRNSIKKEK